jgi:hypothetical protein
VIAVTSRYTWIVLVLVKSKILLKTIGKMNKYPNADIAVLNLHKNRQHWGKKLGIEVTEHTPPSPHYPHIYLHDQVYSDTTFARHGGKYWQRVAMRGQRALVKGQRDDGFIPNMQFVAKGRKLDPERIRCFDDEATGSNYTQPPIIATGVKEVFNSVSERDNSEAMSFLYDMYPYLTNFYGYFDKFRSNSEDNKLIGVIHPHETGRDSDPTFDFLKPKRLRRNGVETSRTVDIVNIPIDYLSIIAHGIKLKKADGDINREREIMWVNDVMMNCMYAQNLYEMGELADELSLIDEQDEYSKIAQKVEQDILEKMWFAEARGGKGAFYALNKDCSPIDEISVSNLFPVLLPNISEQQLESILNLMDESFDTPYPLPSVATTSPNYDPHNREKDRLWRGPVWMNMNFHISEYGLKTQLNRDDLSHRQDLIRRCLMWEDKIINSSTELLDINGPWEHYNPINGKAQRKRVKNFGWSNLGHVMLQSA